VPGEGGHTPAPTLTDREFDVLRTVRDQAGQVDSEMLVSGPGLVRIYLSLARLDGLQPVPRTPAEIARDGARGTDDLSVEALDMFCALLGAVSSGAAVTFAAWGGVYLAGGILSKLADPITHSSFRARFENNPAVGANLASTATVLITRPEPGLHGAAHILTSTLG